MPEYREARRRAEVAQGGMIVTRGGICRGGESWRRGVNVSNREGNRGESAGHKPRTGCPMHAQMEWKRMDGKRAPK
jgi:hypothetical protein